MRNTGVLRRIGSEMLARPSSRHYGYDLCRGAGVKSGTLYPILARMLAEGWVTDGWESPAPQGRPPRRYYRLTAEGRKSLTGIVEE